jgi:adenosine 3'-phospho 5'-phosphosulfate transporter B2
MGTGAAHTNCCTQAMHENPEFFQQATQFAFCFFGLMTSYLIWGYLQELIMTSQFNPTDHVPDGKFPSAAFCVFSNRLFAVIVAMIAVRLRHGSVFSNNVAPLSAFWPPALSNTISSWSQYASLKYVSFPEQTVFKSSKIIAVMLMGKVLQGKTYPWSQYGEAFGISLGVALFSLASYDSDRDSHTETIGLLFLCSYIAFDSFTAQYQDKIYQQYGRPNVDPFQMMLGVNVSAICMTTAGLLLNGDFVVVWEFLLVNPNAAWYNLFTAITSASGQICIFYTIKLFGPIVFTITMTTRQMLSICLSAVLFSHDIGGQAVIGACVVFAVLFYQIRGKYQASLDKKMNNNNNNNNNTGTIELEKKSSRMSNEDEDEEKEKGTAGY